LHLFGREIGPVEFHLLKAPEVEDHTLTRRLGKPGCVRGMHQSEALRAAHSRAGCNKPLYPDHPQFEGFEVRRQWGAARLACVTQG
jgi:hypothetical protein